MELYLVLRRSGFASLEELDAATERSRAEGEKPGARVLWIRSYVLAEEDDRLGTVCVYEASSPEAIRAHAAEARLPVDEIVPVADAVVRDRGLSARRPEASTPRPPARERRRG